MRTTIGLAFVAFTVSCHGDSDARAAPAETLQLQVVGDSVHDAGQVRPGTLLRHVFYIENPSERPVQVGAVRRSCGCTNAEPSSFQIEPGGFVEFDVTADTTQRHGSFSAYVELLERSDSLQPLATVELCAEIIPKFVVDVDPPVIDLGDLTGSPTQAVTVRLRSCATGDAVPIRPVVASVDSALTCELGEEKLSYTEDKRTILEFPVTITLDTFHLRGRFDKRIDFEISPPDEPPSRAFLILRGNSVGFARMEPEELFVGIIPSESETVREVSIVMQPSASSDLEVVTSQTWITASLAESIGPPRIAKMTVCLAPPRTEGFVDEWVEIVCGSERLRLPVTGLVR